MGYGYAETFLIVFLTHPGVIIPTMGSLTTFIPPGSVPPELIPSQGFPPVLSGFWQTLWVWILSLPGEKSPGFAWTMYALYLVFLLIYMYYFVIVRLQKGV